MFRLAGLPIIFLAALCAASPPQDAIKAKYRDFNKCLLKGDSRAMGAWLQANCAANFSYVDYRKKKYDHDGFVNRLLAQMAKTSQVQKSATTVRTFAKAGSSLIATVAFDFKGLVSIESGRTTLTEQSVDYETWVQLGRAWKLQKIVQVNEDIQMSHDGD